MRPVPPLLALSRLAAAATVHACLPAPDPAAAAARVVALTVGARVAPLRASLPPRHPAAPVPWAATTSR